ncbi:KxYKxGKxW signal peptide domain-containing protein [Lactobacillus sp. LC28-10]|uniref:KxYKxGKxW signal peptide domain-containing protein n=1 Tax=Secundilactobacillus angelensis TaxID=2722706 RepID=A0ABX1KYX6_9LACO|nr:KxYKxGKxW signal peptide domain-containing protein [Secundilactobacillus angelensis]MCH5462635.1 KxYKxGKxW signal peptide domain-containing protein [Secundilactobacillus angelensis]NLR19127.1 KxYKxGKxW signal peptide domain-containing protein [Secundilactobacillus angelensis]
MDKKIHYKLYKAGKFWVSAALMSVSIIGAMVITQPTLAKADSIPQTSQEVSQTATEGTNQDATNSSAVESDSDVSTSATQQAASSNTAEANKAVTLSQNSAIETSENESASQPATEAKQAVAAASEHPVDVTDTAPVSVKTEAAQSETQIGGNAVFSVDVNITGIKTELNNAKLVVGLPTGTKPADTLDHYAINDVTPVADVDTNSLTYDFGTINSGIHQIVIYNLNTDKTILKKDDELKFTTVLTADDQTTVTGEAATKITATDATSETSIASTITGPDGTVKKYAASGDNIDWSIAGQVYTAQAGVELLDPDTPLTLTYTVDKNLIFKDVTNGSGIELPAPNIVTNADGSTTLTWTFKPGTLAEQAAQNIKYGVKVSTQVKPDTLSFTTVTNVPELSYTTITGTKVDKKANLPAASVLVTNNNPESYTKVGSIFMMGQISTADGNGGYDTTQNVTTNLDPVVVAEDNPVLKWLDMANEGYLGILNQDTLHELYGDYNYYAIVQNINKGEVLQSIYLSPAKYLPNMTYYSDYGMQDLKVAPTVTLAVQYAGETSYQSLADNLAIDGSENVTRAEMIQMGLDPDKDIQRVWLYYHKDGQGELPTINAEDLTGDNAWTTNADGTQTSNLPAGSYAPLGIYEPVHFTTTVKPDFTGTLSHDFLPQFIVLKKNAAEEDYPAQFYFLQTADKDSGRIETNDRFGFLASTVEVTSEPKGTAQIVTASVLLDGKPVGSQLIAGEHQVTINAQLTSDSQSRLVTSDAFTSYTLLPKGVTLGTQDANGFINATLVDPDYQGTGQQLVKLVSSEQGYLNPGSTVSVGFNVDISSTADPTLTFGVTFMSPEKDIQVPTSVNEQNELAVLGTDAYDFDGNGDTTQATVSANAVYKLLKSSTVHVIGTVTNGSTMGITTDAYSGDTVTVSLLTKPDTDADLQNLSLVDWLPTPGDTGLTTSDSRGSTFTPSLTGPITLPSGWNDKVTVKYSTDLANGVDPSVATWQNADQISDWSKVSGFWIYLDPSAGITVPGGQQVITYKLAVPSKTEKGLVAYNTFYMSANQLSATEPQLVEIKTLGDKPENPENPGNPGNDTPPTNTPETPPTTTPETPPTTTPETPQNTEEPGQPGVVPEETQKVTPKQEVSEGEAKTTETFQKTGTESQTNNAKTTAALPQTNDTQSTFASLVGMLMVSILGAFGIKLRKRHE